MIEITINISIRVKAGRGNVGRASGRGCSGRGPRASPGTIRRLPHQGPTVPCVVRIIRPLRVVRRSPPPRALPLGCERRAFGPDCTMHRAFGNSRPFVLFGVVYPMLPLLDVMVGDVALADITDLPCMLEIRRSMWTSFPYSTFTSSFSLTRAARNNIKRNQFERVGSTLTGIKRIVVVIGIAGLDVLNNRLQEANSREPIAGSKLVFPNHPRSIASPSVSVAISFWLNCSIASGLPMLTIRNKTFRMA